MLTNRIYIYNNKHTTHTHTHTHTQTHTYIYIYIYIIYIYMSPSSCHAARTDFSDLLPPLDPIAYSSLLISMLHPISEKSKPYHLLKQI